jgi:hypothetical protein
MHELEQTLKSQKTAIASVVAGQAQTDDVVEGVVGAMESLHTIVVDRAEEAGEYEGATALTTKGRTKQP